MFVLHLSHLEISIFFFSLELLTRYQSEFHCGKSCFLRPLFISLLNFLCSVYIHMLTLIENMSIQIAHQPSIYVLDTPGVLVPSIPDIETGLKLAAAGSDIYYSIFSWTFVDCLEKKGKIRSEYSCLDHLISYYYVKLKTICSGSVKDSVVGEERIAQYLLAVLNTRGTPLHWRRSIDRENEGSHIDFDEKPSYSLKDLLPRKRRPPTNRSDVHYIEVSYAEDLKWTKIEIVHFQFCKNFSFFVGYCYTSSRGPLYDPYRIQRKPGGRKWPGESYRPAVWSTAEGTEDTT